LGTTIGREPISNPVITREFAPLKMDAFAMKKTSYVRANVDAVISVQDNIWVAIANLLLIATRIVNRKEEIQVQGE
jgi:hypothetical protein